MGLLVGSIKRQPGEIVADIGAPPLRRGRGKNDTYTTLPLSCHMRELLVVCVVVPG